jgi:hypothetical protein
MSRNRPAMIALLVLAAACKGTAQVQVPAGQAVQPAPPPATKLEGFKPAAGTLVTMGFDNLGSTGGISVDVRKLNDTKGSGAKGLVVEIAENQYRTERAFVDADEIGELLKGIDALLEIKANPTPFKNFEVRYTTRGALEITAFNNATTGAIKYAVQAGRITHAQSFIGASDLQILRARFVAGQAKIAEVGGQ